VHCRAKFTFPIGDSIPDRRPTPIGQILGLLTGRELERRTEFGSGDPYLAGTKTLRELTGHFQASRV
jgi:hypothetical protein